MVRIKRLLDILGTLVGLLCLAPVLPFLDRPLLVLALAALGFGFWCDRRGVYLLPTWLATLVGVAGIALYSLRLSRADVATPVVHMLVVLLILRLLSPKQSRDYLQIFLIALFILAGSSLLNLEVSYLVYLVLLVFAVTIGLVLLTVFVTDRGLILPRRDLFRLLRVSLWMPVISLLLMVVFFFVLPRTRHPLWNFLNPSSTALVGLSETVQPGTFAQISTVKNLAFRAEAPEIAPENLYWRALVLNQPQGSRWLREPPPARGSTRLVGSPPVTLTIFPEPRNDRFLITLDRPGQLSGLRHEAFNDQTYKSRSKLDRRVRYQVDASPGADLQVIGELDRDFYLVLPGELSDRVRQTAAQIAAAAADPDARLAALAEFFRDRQLMYAQDDLPAGPQVIDQFLFEKRRGYCEFFASAYVTLARLAGIPARLVGGYHGGVYNPLGGYYLVTEDRAHVWVEVLTAANRWQRVDPSQWAVNAAASFDRDSQSGLNLLRQLVDSVNYHWVQAVVVFDLFQQIELWRNMGEQLRRAEPPTIDMRLTAGLLVLLLLGMGVWIAVRQQRQPREARLLRQFRNRIRQRFGEEAVSPATGLTELAESLGDERCREFARIYQGAVFRDRRLSAAEVERLKELIRSL